MANIHLNTAFGHIRRAPFQAMAAIFVLTITFFVVTFLAVTLYSSEKVLKYFETRPQIIAFLKSDVTESDISLLENKLKNDPRVSSVNFVSKEDALEIYKKATADNPLLTELISPSTFPASLEISVTDLSFAEGLIEEVKSAEQIDQIGFTASLGGEDSLSSVVTKLRNISWYIRIGGGAFALILAGTSFLVLIIIISMRMATRRGEMEILDLIGATPGFIRSPVILEALIYAALGVFAGWLLAFLLVLYATPAVISYFGEIEIFPRDMTKLLALFGIFLGFEMVAGLLLAFLGSILAVSRVKKR